jgi:hypothetical protein
MSAISRRQKITGGEIIQTITTMEQKKQTPRIPRIRKRSLLSPTVST